MLCPSCKSSETKVIDSRTTEGGQAIRRRRSCLTCDRRFTTKERIEEELRLAVIKSDGRRVPYQRDKIQHGVELACVKLPVSQSAILELVDRVEEDLFENHEREVSSEDIGRYVGRQLRQLNSVAYVRFMSVHRKYDSIEEFIEEVRDVKDRVVTEAPNQPSLFERQG